MKVLVVTWHREGYMSYRQHFGILNRLARYCDYVIYGRKYFERYGGPLGNVKKLYDKHRPDIVICYGAMEFIKYENVFGQLKGCLKVCIEPDYHNHFGKEDWYLQFNVVALRNANDTEKIKTRCFWWPWSVDEKEFYPTEDPRRNVIGFAGSSKHHLYTIRSEAIHALLSAGLLEHRMKTIMFSELNDKGEWKDRGRYQQYLREINGLLTSTENRGPFAKTFEGMASGTIILTSPVFHKELLFGDKECFVEYKPDCSDIVDKAEFILNENLVEIADNAYDVCIERHTTDKRIKELYDNLNNLLEGKELTRKWGL